MVNCGLRMLRKRDEHHRLQNDSIKGVKNEGLWGQGRVLRFMCVCVFPGELQKTVTHSVIYLYI